MGVDICLTVLLPVLMAEILTGQELPVSSGMILSRRLHLFASHWGLLLMSLHLGLHWSIVVKQAGKLRKREDPDSLLVWLARGLAAVVALFGILAFVRQNMADYLFLRTAFVFWDETKTAILFFAEVIAIMGLFIAIGYYGSRLLTGGNVVR